jgi:gliding motility-associated-like protein
MAVFNRWGEKIFQATQPSQSWDGTYKGQPQPMGNYRYFIDYEYLPHKARRELDGILMLVR